MSTAPICRNLAPRLMLAIRAAGAVALLGVAGGCTSTDRYDVPRPMSNVPPAATSQGAGSGSINAPYYQGSSPDFPRGTRGHSKAP